VLDKPYSDIEYIRLSTASGSMITFSIVAFGKMISRSPSKSPFTALFSWGATSFEEDALDIRHSIAFEVLEATLPNLFP